MNQKVKDILFSMKLSVVLLFFIALGAAVATFLENDYGNEAARALVYDSLWFEILLLVIGINLAGSIFRYRMWKLDKAAIFVFHISFLVILSGAAVTRFFGYEGVMHIREGGSAASFLSDETYVELAVSRGGERETTRQRVLISPLTGCSVALHAGEVKAHSTECYHRAEETVVPSSRGKAYLELMVSPEGSKGQVVMLGEGDQFREGDLHIAFNTSVPTGTTAIHIQGSPEQLVMKSTAPVTFMNMDNQLKGNLPPGALQPLLRRRLYTAKGVSFVLKNVIPSGEKSLVPVQAREGFSGIQLDVASGGEIKTVALLGTKGAMGAPVPIHFSNGTEVILRYGSVNLNLPFSIRLDDFKMERYIGSETPASYESYVTLLDPELQTGDEKYHIYMNHILVHKGFRFYQSSYDRDEKGTILSVAHDPGKLPTYVGYILMSLGFLIAPFSGSSRFRRLLNMVSRDRMTKHTGKFVLLLITLTVAFHPGRTFADELPGGVYVVDVRLADQFGHLVVHDVQGRLKPVNTLSTEVMRKLARTDSLYGLTSDQILLSMLVDPRSWQRVALIKISDESVKRLLDLGQAQQYASFHDFIDVSTGGRYKLQQELEDVNRIPASRRSKLDKEIIKIDEKFNIAYMALHGDMMRLFPVPGDVTGRWHTPEDVSKYLDPQGSRTLETGWQKFLEACNSKDWKKAEESLHWIEEYQRKGAGEQYPRKKTIDAEILFNRWNIFERLTPVYLILGFVLLMMVFLPIIRPSMRSDLVMRLITIVISVAFAAHTLGLALRWYISGHAPWSNGYESLIYISWATILAGFLFARSSSFALAATSIVGGLALFVAHLSWMDPQITNLVPVLKSYWLTIHVSIISASYGFLSLGAILGFITLFLYIMRNKKNERIDYAIVELVRIDEMSLMIGLAFLSIGNILGAVWANESWGRYWSWDPKETWTLISMLVYAALLHFRFIPALRNNYAFAAGSLLAFASVIMTYFGVNYYLSGLHSYAAGDPVPVPTFLYYTVATIILLLLFSARKGEQWMKLRHNRNEG